METTTNRRGLSLTQAVSLTTLMLGFITIWIHLEVRIAEINVELVNLKQDIQQHKFDNRKDMEQLRSDNQENTRRILERVDEIQIYLRKP